MPQVKKQSGGANGSSAQAKRSPGNAVLEKYFHDSLKDIYWAEKQLTRALPKMKKAATTEVLKEAIEEHLEQTREHVARLEEVFDMLDRKPQAKKCEAMEGLIKEGETVIEETDADTMTRDVAIIIAAQKVEHYEIATYGGMTQLAKTMKLDEIAEILGSTLEEEKQTDARLTEIAEKGINRQAEQEEAG